MKKLFALLLVAAMCFSLVACGSGNKAFEASKLAYDTIDTAYEITSQYGEDIYKVWCLGIDEEDKILDKGIEYLATELSLSEEELKAGVDYMVKIFLPADWYGLTNDTDWLGGYSDCIDIINKDTDNVFKLVEENLFSFCVMLVQSAYIVNGDIEKAQTALDTAKEQMKELSEKYSDYEHYPNLKGCYVTTNTFFEFCQNPACSLKEFETTLNDYKEETSDYISNLDYIFEE